MSVQETFLAFSELQIQKKLAKNYQFPLLNLPRVVLLECIENLDVLEVILFSILSKRAKAIAKHIRWNLLDISLQKCGRHSQICLRFPSDQNQKWIVNYKKKMGDLPELKSDRIGPQLCHNLFLKDNGNAIEDIKQMTEHICEVFRSPIWEIRIFDKSLIEWIIKFQPTIRYVWIEKYVVVSAKLLNHIFKSLKVTEHFGVISNENINGKIKITEPIPYRSISIENPYCVTLPSILNGNNSVIRLDSSNLTPMDINTILREWQMGTKLRNLEFLWIDTSTSLDLASYTKEVMKDLNSTKDVKNDGRPTTVKIYDGNTMTLPPENGVLNLVRSDGMMGSIFRYIMDEGREKQIHIMFQIWRRQS